MKRNTSIRSRVARYKQEVKRGVSRTWGKPLTDKQIAYRNGYLTLPYMSSDECKATWERLSKNPALNNSVEGAFLKGRARRGWSEGSTAFWKALKSGVIKTNSIDLNSDGLVIDLHSPFFDDDNFDDDNLGD